MTKNKCLDCGDCEVLNLFSTVYGVICGECLNRVNCPTDTSKSEPTYNDLQKQLDEGATK